MLPDFPDTKSELLRKALRRVAELEVQKHPILAQITTYMQHEGRSSNFEQIGFGRKSQESKAHRVEIPVRHDEVPDVVGAALEAKLALLADQIGSHKVKMMIERTTEAAEQTGNKVDAQGKAPTGALLLDVIDKVQESFDEDGRSRHSWLVHPEMLPALKRASDEIENDPELRNRHTAIIERQRERWLDRESRRKLVD